MNVKVALCACEVNEMSGKKWINPTYHYVDGKQRMLPEYNQWFDMYQRCTSERSKHLRKAYQDCILQASWYSYDSWLDWARQQPNFLKRDSGGNLYQIDKDLFGDGLMYEETICCFLPKAVNQALQNNTKGFQVLPNGKYRVKTSFEGVAKNVGCFSTKGEATEAYLSAKNDMLQALADKWQEFLPEHHYLALLNYKFIIEEKK